MALAQAGCGKFHPINIPIINTSSVLIRGFRFWPDSNRSKYGKSCLVLERRGRLLQYPAILDAAIAEEG